MHLRNENPGYAYVSYHRSSEHCILMDMLTTRKKATLFPSDTLPGLKKLSKVLPRPVVASKVRFAAGRGKGSEKGRCREKGEREGEGPPKKCVGSAS